MNNIIEARNLPEKENIYLRKGMFGYRVVYPNQNENGSINWINLLIGGWGNLFKLLFVLFIIFCFIFGTMEMISSCKDMAKNPCKYISIDCSINSGIEIPKLNLSVVREYEQQ